MELKELQITYKSAKEKIINDFFNTLRAYHFAYIATLRDIKFVGNKTHLISCNMRKYLICFLMIINFRISFCQKIVWEKFIDSIVSFSSPRTADFNGDGVLDIVVGAGTEGKGNVYNVCAFDGKTGNLLWNSYLRDEAYTSAVFLDITNDSIPDVFIGGRSADFRAINGKDGSVIWRFLPEGDTILPLNLGWFNFYTPQLIPDQNSDGVMDLLQANGGDGTQLPADTIRPAGCLMVFDASKGQVLAKATVPDSHEVYCSPLIVDFLQNGNYSVIYGTGGETVRGSLWKVSLTDLMNNNLAGSLQLATSSSKGFIAPPSLTDLNNDNVLDIIVSSFDGQVIAIDGKTNQELWKVTVTDGETYTTPAIGNFTGDSIPDVFVNFGIGVYPFYTKWVQMMIDGSTGNIKYTDSIGVYQLMSCVSADYNGDGWDEIVFTDNRMFFTASHDILMIDFKNDTIYKILSGQPGASIVSTPWIGDLDGNDTLDLVYTFTPDTTQIWVVDKGWKMQRINLQKKKNGEIKWGAYLGSFYNGIYNNLDIISSQSENQTEDEILIYPNPFKNIFNGLTIQPGKKIKEFRLIDPLGRVLLDSPVFEERFTIKLPGLTPGLYLIQFKTLRGEWKQCKKIIVLENIRN